MTDADLAGAVLTIDLGAVVENYRRLKAMLGATECAGVVKADAYGLGAERVGPALAAAGCKRFFVALALEGVRLRRVLPEAEIHVLGGVLAGSEDAFLEQRLVPVLNGLAAVSSWSALAKKRGLPLAADVHVDTGMSRLGLPPDELETLAREPGRLDGIDVKYVISHLACADQREHPKNREQLEFFRRVRRRVPAGRASFANSSGIFLGADYHFDLARPGVALYGVNPTPGAPNPMAETVRLQGKIVQVRRVDSGDTVGYGAAHRIDAPGRVATVAVGYADGYLRSLSGRGTGYVGEHPAPLVGRVSMDLIGFDVSRVPDALAQPGALVDLIGPRNPPDQVAAAAGTIAYEILTGLGSRYHRVYLEPGPAAAGGAGGGR